jgi:hypothetical protein
VWEKGEVRTGFGVGKTPEENRPLTRQRSRWKDNIKLDLKEIGWDGVHCTDWFRIGTRSGLTVNALMNVRVAYIAGNFLIC